MPGQKAPRDFVDPGRGPVRIPVMLPFNDKKIYREARFLKRSLCAMCGIEGEEFVLIANDYLHRNFLIRESHCIEFVGTSPGASMNADRRKIIRLQHGQYQRVDRPTGLSKEIDLALIERVLDSRCVNGSCDELWSVFLQPPAISVKRVGRQ